MAVLPGLFALSGLNLPPVSYFLSPCPAFPVVSRLGARVQVCWVSPQPQLIPIPYRCLGQSHSSLRLGWGRGCCGAAGSRDGAGDGQGESLRAGGTARGVRGGTLPRGRATQIANLWCKKMQVPESDCGGRLFSSGLSGRWTGAAVSVCLPCAWLAPRPQRDRSLGGPLEGTLAGAEALDPVQLLPPEEAFLLTRTREQAPKSSWGDGRPGEEHPPAPCIAAGGCQAGGTCPSPWGQAGKPRGLERAAPGQIAPQRLPAFSSPRFFFLFSPPG